jgi:hypothetical protein
MNDRLKEAENLLRKYNQNHVVEILEKLERC